MESDDRCGGVLEGGSDFIVAPRFGTSAGSRRLSLGIWPDRGGHVLLDMGNLLLLHFSIGQLSQICDRYLYFYTVRACQVYLSIRPKMNVVIIAPKAPIPPRLLTP
jgi:hypothetical protein